jgi:ADP-ribose pyrophosphatase YjhB (NUDIX family)
MNNLSPYHSYHPSEVFRYCPFCGAADFAWDGVKAHNCNACGKRFYTNSAAAVAAIIQNPDGDILLVRRKFDPAKGTLDLPGGFVDLNETAEHAIVREVKEEVGLDIVQLNFWKTFSNQYVYGGVLYFTTDLIYAAQVADFASMQAADDAAACIFLPKNKIDINHIGLTSIKKVVQEWIRTY